MGEIADGLLAADDGAVRAALGQELKRIEGAGPADVLGLAADAPADEVRARFLAMAKLYHPNRFARRPRDLKKLANEIFLLVRRAYQRMGERPLAATGGAAVVAGGTGAAAAAVAARASELSPPSQPRLDVDIALARRRRARSRPFMTPASVTQPNRIEVVEPGRRREEDQKELFDAALVELSKGHLSSARAALRALVAESPSERPFRAYLHYVTGRMHESAGRASEAVVEYDRALGFDPHLEIARKAKELLNGSTGPGGTGRFGRWFRK